MQNFLLFKTLEKEWVMSNIEKKVKNVLQDKFPSGGREKDIIEEMVNILVKAGGIDKKNKSKQIKEGERR